MFTDQQLREFWEQGYVCLGQVASDEEVEALRTRMDDIMQGRYGYPGMFFQLDSDSGSYGDVPGAVGFSGPSVNYRKIQDLERDDVFLRYMQHPVFHSICRQLIGEGISVFRSMFMNKPPHKGTRLPYHQDGGSQWKLTLDPILTVWTALDDATVENGCVEIIPGSHQLGLLSERGHTITPEQEAKYCSDERGVFLPARAGEAMVLHNWLLHRSGVNRTERPRRAFSSCYMDVATRRVGEPDASFPQIFGEGALEPSACEPEIAAAH